MHNPIDKIILTASGGPFRTMSRQELEHVTKKQALKHPNWNMGAKNYYRLGFYDEQRI